MPEAPDVEGHKRLVQHHAVGQTVTDVSVTDAGVVRGVNEDDFIRMIIGVRFTECRRHGKWLIIETSGRAIVMHFGMTGTLRWSTAVETSERWDRVRLSFDDGMLHYSDKRKLGGIWLTDSDEIGSVIGPIGPDVAEISTRTLTTQLQTRRGSIKAVLLQQDVVAGLGNTLSDEVLWRAHIHPATHITDLGKADHRRLRNAIKAAVNSSFKLGRIPRTHNWLAGARTPGSPCPRCGHQLSTSTIASRTSVWCPRCQVRHEQLASS